MFARPIVTRTDALHGFYPAKSCHQNYLTLSPGNLYIAINDIPKVENLKQLFPQRYQDRPVLVSVGGF